MDFEVLGELQQRGRFFYEMFPGAKASDEWQRHRDQLDEREQAENPRSSPSVANDQEEKSSDAE